MSRSCKSQVVFDDWYSLLHVLAGALTATFLRIFPPTSLVIVITFTAYQVHEKEKELSKLGDFIEFIIGYLLGACLINTLNLLNTW